MIIDKTLQVPRQKELQEIDLYCKEKGYSHDEVVFVGDDYGMGGNDGSVYPADFHFVRIDNYRAFCDVMATWAE